MDEDRADQEIARARFRERYGRREGSPGEGLIDVLAAGVVRLMRAFAWLLSKGKRKP